MAVADPVFVTELHTEGSLTPKRLPFSLDLSCPIALPPRVSSARPWPYAIAGPSTAPLEPASRFLRRRYLETLYLSDVLFPIDHLVQDVTGLSSAAQTSFELADAIRPLLMPLAQVEARHRKAILPLLSACVSAASHPSSDLAKGLVGDAMCASTLDADEKDVLRVAMEIRQSSRLASEGAIVDARKLRAELEKRETLLQVALLFIYISHAPPAVLKKRKREKKRSEPPSVADNPQAALEVLMDRLSVWSAISELESGPSTAENETQVMLQAFWTSVIRPNFLALQREICASFHLKVFATALAVDAISNKEVAPIKKSRKPTMTRARPSSDALTQPDFRPDSRSTTGHRSLSRAPSEVGSVGSTSRERSLSRSLSARPTESLEMRRSRSKSIDPAPATDSSRQSAPKKGLMRAPSGGKDLFKGRQVGLLKRNSSLIARRPAQRDSQSQSQASLGRSESQARVGLLGRKTSNPKGRRPSEESQSQAAQPGTLVFATPSKPKLADSIFGPRLGFVAPTPIREEPASSERPTSIAETPHSFGRMFKAAESGVTETPQTSTRSFVPSTGRSYAGMAINALNSIERVAGSDEDSDLGDLMVMTDEEGDED